MKPMSALDWAFLAALITSLFLGAWRGLIYEVLSIAGWVISFVLAQWFALDAAALLSDLDALGESSRYAIGFVLVFVSALFGCGLLAWVAKKLVEVIGLRPVDRTLGALFGVARGVVLLLVVAVLARLTPVHETSHWRESLGAGILTQLLEMLRPALPQEFAKHLP